MKKGDRVWCTSCAQVDVCTDEFECVHCDSPDVFTAEDLIQGEIDNAYDRERQDMLGFILDEYRRALKPKTKRKK